MRIGGRQISSYVRANPIMADVLQRLDTKEANSIVQVLLVLGCLSTSACWLWWQCHVCSCAPCNMIDVSPLACEDELPIHRCCHL